MWYIKQAFTFQPVAVKTKDQRKEILPERENESKYRVQLRFTIIKVEGFLFGRTGEKFEKPQLMGMDYFFMLICLHCNIRFIVAYTNLTLQWGGFLVWLVYALTHVVVCPTLAYLFTFFGYIGERSFINLWDLMPMFIGISYSVIFLEIFKLVDVGIVLSSGVLSMPIIYRFIGNKNKTNPDVLNCTERAPFTPAVATPYGISQNYTDLGYNSNSLNYMEMQRAHIRERFLCVIWLFVIALGCFKYQRYRYPMRILPMLMGAFFVMLLIIMSLASRNPVLTAITWTKENYYDVRPYLEVFVFALCDYIPSHWVTIGYLCPQKIIPLQIWSISVIKALFGFYITYTIPYILESYRIYTNAVNDMCMQTFGSHFLFVNIPIALQYTMPTIMYASYTIFILIILMNGILELILAVKLFTTAVCKLVPAIHRFRNVFHIAFALFTFLISLAFCADSTHYVFYYMHVKSYYFSYFVIVMASVCGIGIYGIHRLRADYNHVYGTEFPWSKATKLLLVLCLAIFILFILHLCSRDDYYDEHDIIYWLTCLLTISPLMAGPILVITKRSKYRGYFYPLDVWGASEDVMRIARRRKILKHMLVYHTKCACAHSCMLLDPQLTQDIHAELEMRLNVLGEPILTKRKF